MLQILGGAVVGFVIANIFNLIEMGMIYKVMKDMKEMLKQFKLEGKTDRWLT